VEHAWHRDFHFDVNYNLIEGKIVMTEIKFEIIEKVAVLSESKTGWTKELNLISWNGRDSKYDLRDWSPENGKMGKEITLSNEEIKNLKNTLDKISNLG
jgi:hypothetical protein